MFHHAVANPGKLFQFFGFLGELFDGVGQSRNKFGCFLVAAVTADNGAVNFQQLRGLAQDASNLLVVHGVIIMRTGFESSPVPLRNKKTGRGNLPAGPYNYCTVVYAAFCTSAACGPFGPCTISNSTASPSCNVR